MGGKIACVVELEGATTFGDIAKDVAMHVAADTPEYLSSEDVPKDLLEKEKEIAKSQIKNKPENIVDKIVEGKINAFYDSVCLLNQKYIKDTSITVKQYVEASGLKSNKTLSIKNFWYWKIGQ
jgi:elongation factor Ts